MAIGIATLLVLLAIGFFIRQASSEQRLDLIYSLGFSPLKTSAEVRFDTSLPIVTIWKTITDVSNFHLWFPWVKKVRVRNNDADRWVLKHSLDRFRPEVGREFWIKPFFGSPFTRCRFVGMTVNQQLELEMHFFPLCREFVTFTITPFANCTELEYRTKNKGILSSITALMFSWRGKYVLENLANFIPPLTETKIASNDDVEATTFAVDDAFINALVAKAMTNSEEILNLLTEKKIRAKAKSTLVKSKRKGEIPQVSPEAISAVEQFLSGNISTAVPPENEKLKASNGNDDVESLVQKVLETGDMEPINKITDKA